MSLLDRRWLVVPWLGVAFFAAMAMAGDYGRFQQDKSAQQKELLRVRDVLSKAADAWAEQGREIAQQYRTEEERQSITKSLIALEKQSAQARDALSQLPASIFFPEAMAAEEKMAGRLKSLSDIVHGLFEAKTELLDAQARLADAPYNIMRIRRQSHYYLSVMDLFNYYLTQDTLAQTESAQISLQETVNDLIEEANRWREKLDLERIDMIDEAASVDEAVLREAKMDYSAYLRARLRVFSSQRLLRRN
jgi:hypothetical protein